MAVNEQKEKKKIKKSGIFIGLVLALVIITVFLFWRGKDSVQPVSTPLNPTSSQETQAVEAQSTSKSEELNYTKESETATESAETEQTEAEVEAPDLDAIADEVLPVSDIKAAMYDYDAAIDMIKAIENYEENERLVAAIASYEEQKAACVVWPDNTAISHLFVHSLIVDTSRAFGPQSEQVLGYNRYMTTVSEFNAMMEQMYERGYVLVSIHDIATVTTMEDGSKKLVKNDICLPPGKTPFVLSQDDVNYYAYMNNSGFADRLVIGEDGLPTCQYTEIDGTVKFGEYDMAPIIDRFVKEHPDFSYRGAKGILAVTGFEGALGYNTAWHRYSDLNDPKQAAELAEQQRLATEVADALKADGWEFASHSYTHTSMTTNTIDRVIDDTDRWAAQVKPILGDTDIYIYPFGADICDWTGYSGEKYETLKAAGFWYFCNVDSARYWIQIRDEYMRMGRINADGERMVLSPEKLEYFFDVDSVYDTSRPVLNLE